MRPIATLAFALAALLLSRGPAEASSKNTAGSAGEFLTLGAGARALGMGEAYGPIASGADAIYWNPAGLAQTSRGNLSYSHVEMLRYFHHDFLAYARPVSSLGGTIGAAATLFYQDSLQQVTNANQTIGTFQPHSEAIALAYARSFSVAEAAPPAGRRTATGDTNAYFIFPDSPADNLRPARENSDGGGNLEVGLAVKYISESLNTRSASAVAADGGARYHPPRLEGLALSAAFRNIGTKERFISDRESLPAEVDAGGAYGFRLGSDSRLLTAVEAAVPYYGQVYGKIGTEYSAPVNDWARAAVRLGYKTQSDSGLNALSGVTAGVGAAMRRLSVDFGFEPMAALGEVYRLSLSFKF